MKRNWYAIAILALLAAVGLLALGWLTFGRLLTIGKIPTMVTDAMLSFSTNKYVIMLIINVLLLLLGCVREWMALGTVFGTPVGQRAVLPMAGMPAGGFIVLGILCAIWRAAAAKRKEYLKKEARDTLTVHYQKEGNREP